MRHIITVFLFCFISYSAHATTCATGTVAVNRNDAIMLLPDCGTYQTIGVATSENFPDLACAAGAIVIKSSHGASASIYKNQHTDPALHIKINNTECFINLVSGSENNTIHINYNNNIYHTSELKLCTSLNPSADTVQISPATNITNWSGTTGQTTVKGISHCGISTANIGDSISAVALSSTATENIFCWCRMVSPAISQWTFSMEFASATNCNMYCAANCAENFAGHNIFRASMIKSIEK